jgi:hypothetical protein
MNERLRARRSHHASWMQARLASQAAVALRIASKRNAERQARAHILLECDVHATVASR